MPHRLLSENDRKEQLSQAYVAALAAGCGYTVSIPNLDRDSVDIQVSSGSSRRASVQFQLKATVSPDWSDDGLKFQLKQKNYNDLVCVRQVPLLLAVMVLPAQEQDWLTVSLNEMILKQCVWWHCMIGNATTDQGSKQVLISTTNILDQKSLCDLIRRSEEGTL
ncbi:MULTISPECIES: DUF4365 domain-containing protein [unclassified Yoonia]|uniref:DUF4365 domain-containing protein n=1 Tax=unclassified Yoonia TaxID=2629118 RepID=UPI002AFE822D|nr:MULTISPECIES: DUF4365 domain-containing protein [unclassified Yoonia]